MSRLPWALGIVLALVAGLAIGYVAGTAQQAPSRGPHPEGPATQPRPRQTLDLESRETELERRIASLEADLAAKAREVEEAKAALAAAKSAAATDPGPEAAAPEDRQKSLVAASKAFQELAKKGQLAFLSPENAGVVKQLALDLIAAGDLAYEFLEEALDGSDSAQRFLAAALLDDLDMEKSLPLLRKALLENPDDWVRRMASHSLATRKVEEAVPDLRKAMTDDKDWGVRVNSAYGLAKMGHKDGLDSLVEAYKDESHAVQERLGVLGGIADVADPSTAPIFRELLATSMDDTTLILSISAVEKMKDQASLGALQAIIQGSRSSLVKEPAKKAYNTIYGQEVYR